MLKKAAAAVALFILTLLFSFLWHFPTESVLKHQLSKLEQKSGMKVSYTTGQFSLNHIILDNVDLLGKEKRLFAFDKVDASYFPSKITLKAEKGQGTLQADVTPSKAKITFGSLQVVSEGTKFFKNITLTGTIDYNQKKKTGAGKFTADLKGSLDPMITTDVIADTEVQFNPAEITFNLTNIKGTDLTGSGMIILTPEADFGNSKLSGTLNLNAKGTPVKIKISGTVKSPSALPDLGSGSFGSRSGSITSPAACPTPSPMPAPPSPVAPRTPTVAYPPAGTTYSPPPAVPPPEPPAPSPSPSPSPSPNPTPSPAPSPETPPMNDTI